MSVFAHAPDGHGRSRLPIVVAAIAVVAVVAVTVGVWLRGGTPPPAESTPPSRPDTARQAQRTERPASAAPEPAAPRAAARAPRRAEKPAEPAPPAPVEAPPETGTLTIDSDVAGASVFIDREYVGTTPLTVRDVKPGSHKVNVSAEGHEGWSDTIDVAPGPRDLLVRFKEVRLDAAIAVVHKHRFGACRGRLSATPQGLRYETADKDDAFTLPFAEVETLEVDYLKKNLRVKKRGGKTWNFTDPDENADRLFVFHRDVDKARARLARGDASAR